MHSDTLSPCIVFHTLILPSCTMTDAISDKNLLLCSVDLKIKLENLKQRICGSLWHSSPPFTSDVTSKQCMSALHTKQEDKTMRCTGWQDTSLSRSILEL